MPHYSTDTKFIQRAAIAQRVYDSVYHRTESFIDDNIGVDLAYLMGAILGDSYVDWTEEIRPERPAILDILSGFDKNSDLWKYIRM